VFDAEWVGAVKTIVDLMEVEQYHEEKSKYRYVELSRNGLGGPVSYTGMTWTGFRPSDDPCQFHYLIPANAFAVTTLENAVEILKSMADPDLALAERAAKLADQIDEGIHKYGTKEMAGYGKIYAFEADGKGGQNFMDDANVPSLLSMSYLGYKTKRDPTGEIAKNTRKWVLSKENRFMVNQKFKGIGSPHTPPGRIWPMSLIVEILTTDDASNIKSLFQTLQDTDAGTNLMHESFNANNPASFTRKWFAWANSLFSEAIMAKIDVICPKK
jgi:meiotically up-regulated gene 157 (Mug157) protein